MNGRPSPSVLAVTVLDPLCDLNWDRLVISHPGFSFFHSAAWARVLSRTYGHTPFFLRFADADKSVALLPLMEVASPLTGRRGVSLPFSDFCQPLTSNGWRKESLMEKLVELGRERRWRYFEVRGGRETLPASATAVTKYYGHRLNLTLGIDELFAHFQSSVRRAIRKAEKSGLAVEMTNSREGLMDFYRLHVRTRRRHGTAPQPLSFFFNIYEEIIKADLGFVVLAKDGTRLVAGAVFFHSGQAGLYKFGASDERA